MNRIRKSICIIVAVCSLLFIAVPFTSAVSLKLTTLKSYKHPIDKFTIKVPKGWEVDESGVDGTSVSFHQLNQQKERIGPNVNVILDTIGKTFKEEVEDIQKNLPEVLPGYQMLSNKAFRLGGKDVKAHIFEGTFFDGEISVRLSQLMVAKDKKLYVISAATEASYWKKYSKTYNKILKSFRPQ